MVERENVNEVPSSSRENKELQIVTLRSQQFKLPDGWFVVERPRISGSQVDRYYYEPRTRRQFRSLIAVQRYLAEETRDLTTERIISENKDNTYIESGTGRQFLDTRRFESRATPMSAVKSGNRKQSAAHGVKSCENPVKKRFSVGEDKITLKASFQSTHSENTDSAKKFHFGEDERGSIHNLPRPPAKVSWVLSGPGGFWSPLLDGSIVPESEKLKWSEAFVQSVHEGGNNGQWT